MSGRLEHGRPEPLGAHWDGRGVNFALFSANAEKVQLCLFDASGRRETRRLALGARTGDIWHGYLQGAAPGQLYGYRVSGPYAPERGHRFNVHKLLVDPYARALHGQVVWHEANHAHRFGDPAGDLSFDTRDNAAHMPKCVVVCAAPDAAEGPRRPWAETVIYELHVKGMTRRHPHVSPAMRGRLGGLAAPAVMDHIVRLGATAVEIMPLFPFADETHLALGGLGNYWGYNPFCFFAVDPRYLTAGFDGEFRTVIETFHRAGLEVILDVVFNHTAEGGRLGPMLSLRGIDNASYYRLEPGSPRDYADWSGCGNTLNGSHPQVRRMMLDCLRAWAVEYGVDGFRFDLASTLGRTADGFDAEAPIFKDIAADPCLSRLKLIAEPWDADGSHLGLFPAAWGQWNDRFRDAVRAFWRGDGGRAGALATAIGGSDGLFGSPLQSLNFVTSHDGFTLQDLVSYDAKDNRANGEGNRDGAEGNLSWNCGAEGPTENADINALRFRQKRNLIATLMLSRGVPMLLAGDELGRTQRGNNNAYCQDNEISWIDWRDRGGEDRAFLGFVRALVALRRSEPALRGAHFFTGRPAAPGGDKDIAWLHPDGREMQDRDWQDGGLRCFGFLLGEAGPPLAVLMNGGPAAVSFRLPPRIARGAWRLRIDTSLQTPPGAKVGGAHPLAAHALVVIAEARSHED